MKRFVLYFIIAFSTIVISMFLNAIIWGILIVISLGMTKLIWGLFKSDAKKLLIAVSVMLVYAWVTILYGFVYYYLSFLPGDHIQPSFDISSTGILNSIYFSFVTITTLGYGDFRPISWIAKFLVISQLIAGIFMIVIGLNRVIGNNKNSSQ
ncbi:MAG: potassium channel family protein [Planctomycetes bacterium]|nr:potassium channel family protein [Planctomycetota bacterium]MBU1517806.1 potassium channel family protein [Planctomycetota bacterium]MBU2457280.1 potassium channel family protein [Planctomycetota bacterium]MBU2596137.1 potassium channel family protein [Planctomycetota bacterium]